MKKGLGRFSLKTDQHVLQLCDIFRMILCTFLLIAKKRLDRFSQKVINANLKRVPKNGFLIFEIGAVIFKKRRRLTS